MGADVGSMPELPEVETVCAGLRSTCLQDKITQVVLNRPNLRIPFPQNLSGVAKGAQISRITRRAKYIQLHLDTGYILAIHLGMSGRIEIFPAGVVYTPAVHDHMLFYFESGQRVVLNDARRFGMVYLFRQEELADHPAFAHLGPEPLGNEFSAPYLRQKLKGRKQAIKISIMDQRIVVGVGNIYACEALYRSGISPQMASSKLSKDGAENLVKAVRQVLQEAIAAGGSSLRDYKQANGELGYFQHNFSVYNREGQACADCRCDLAATGGVQRIIQGGRSTFFCPVRQVKK